MIRGEWSWPLHGDLDELLIGEGVDLYRKGRYSNSKRACIDPSSVLRQAHRCVCYTKKKLHRAFDFGPCAFRMSGRKARSWQGHCISDSSAFPTFRRYSNHLSHRIEHSPWRRRSARPLRRIQALQSVRRSVTLTHSSSEDDLSDPLWQKGKTEASKEIVTPPEPASLLGLPRELRDKIYGFDMEDGTRELKHMITTPFGSMRSNSSSHRFVEPADSYERRLWRSFTISGSMSRL